LPQEPHPPHVPGGGGAEVAPGIVGIGVGLGAAEQ